MLEKYSKNMIERGRLSALKFIKFLENYGYIIHNKAEIQQTNWHDVDIKFYKKTLIDII